MDKIIAILNEATGNKVRPTDNPNIFVVSAVVLDETFSEEKSDESKLVFANEIVAYGINGPIGFTLFGLRSELPDEADESVSGNSSAFNYVLMHMTDPNDGFTFEDDVYIAESQTGENSLSPDAVALIDKRTELLRETKSPTLLAGMMMTQALAGKPGTVFYSQLNKDLAEKVEEI